MYIWTLLQLCYNYTCRNFSTKHLHRILHEHWQKPIVIFLSGDHTHVPCSLELHESYKPRITSYDNVPETRHMISKKYPFYKSSNSVLKGRVFECAEA